MLPLEERPAWLAALPAQYDVLREPLRRLLEVQAGLQTRPFLDAFTSGIEGLTPPATVIVGDLVGPYRLIQQLGDGGMGSVWLAERADGTLKRRVALKLPRMVWARDLAARMARERDILGSLEHPNIARLYDAGVDQLGRPFLALEYVEGARIDQYCDDNELSIPARVRLFLQVLDAVDYAHVNLVLHRDLKPGNVLINQRGEVRLLDFGIAKLMGDEETPPSVDLNSRTLARAMTPRYASPEQVQHLRLTLASDVYSLGVMLYELLVGTSPLITQKGSRAEIETAILEGYLKTPSRAKIEEAAAARRATTPSRLSRTLRGDLDAVLLKALSSNVSDRYPSVEAFRADLVRWLDERPVLAKPPSRLSIVQKFVARNTLAVSLGSVATAAIITATIIAILQAHEAQLESRRATATRDFLIGLFENANPELHGGRDVSVREILRRAELDLDESKNFEIEVKSDLYATLSRMWFFIGDFEKSRVLTKKRIDVLSTLGPTPLHIAALSDLAETAIQIESLSDLKIALDGLNDVSRTTSLSLSQRADYFWYQGWYDLRTGSYVESYDRFATALRTSKEINDPDRMLRSTYGKALSSALSGNRRGALKSYEEGKRLLDTLDLSTVDRVRRESELVSALYHLGEYSFGWPLINELFNESNKLYGDFNPSQRSIQTLWALWGIRMGQSLEVRNWLVSRKNDARRLAMSIEDESEIRFEPLEIEALLEIGEWESAQKKRVEALNAFQQMTLDTRLLIAVLTLEEKLMAGQIGSFKEELSSKEWQNATPQGGNKDWVIYKNLYDGIDLFIDGRYEEAKRSFSQGRINGVEEFGPSHPRTLVISFNEVLAELLSTPNSDIDSRKLNALVNIVDEMALRLPVDGQVVLRGRAVVEKLSDANEIKRFRREASYRQKNLLH